MGKRLNRRDFLRIGGTGAGVVLVGSVAGIEFSAPISEAAIPGGSLNPTTLPKFATPLAVPGVMPRTSVITNKAGLATDYYEIALRQFAQQVLPAGFPRTTVWGYGPASGSGVFSSPSLSIEATAQRPVRVKWLNQLVDGSGRYLPHLLTVDPTLHWANPAGGLTGRDSRPTFTTTPGPYTGPVPMVTHLHGGNAVGDESDGYAEAWFLPAAKNLPTGYATSGTWYSFFAGKAAARNGTSWAAGAATYDYPNANRESGLWYHDHTLGITRLNVYAGTAGNYFVRGGASGAGAIRDTRTGAVAVLPGPAPRAGDAKGTRYFEIPLTIQDRSFDANGGLFYPSSRAFFDAIAGPYVPTTDLSPMWNPEFFGNTMMVNGNTWPFQQVEKRRYRFRVLNACDSRALILDFAPITGVSVWQIGNDGGFLAAPVSLTTATQNRLLLAPGERADIVVDFTNVPAGNYVLGNVGPDSPYGGGQPGAAFPVADPATTGQVMQFRVVAATSADTSTPPQFLQLPAITPLPATTVKRPVALVEMMSMSFPGAPSGAMLGTVSGDPNASTSSYTGRMWAEPVTENPATGAVEVWEIYNTTVDAHPIHLHEVVFEVVNRQRISVNTKTMKVKVVSGSVRGPAPGESGFKDTVVCLPGEVTRIKARFSTPGQYQWHCHIVSHEDNEMMRPLRVGPSQPGEPA